MTAPKPAPPALSPSFFRRRFAPLISGWIAAAIVAGLIYWFEKSMPAFHDVVIPFYWIIAGLLLLATWRWFRTRGRQRRGGDRRHSDRRHTGDRSAPSS